MGPELATQRSVRQPIVAQLGADGFVDAVEIGHGGFGVVYRCTQVELDRVVAVKVLTVDLDENRLRFEREQRAMARLTGHPNIVAVFQVGETYVGHPYIVMPFYRKGCIQTEISRLGRLSLSDTLRLGVKIAGALESAHHLDILHRDVKPANVLLTDYGEPALTDFGIAHMVGGFRTESGVFTGSPSFSAPEIFAGHVPDRSSDVYGLGATLFCALTGHAPFERRSGEQVVAQVRRIISEEVADLGDYDVDQDVATVIGKALSRNPDDRPSSVEFGEELQRLQRDHDLDIDVMALQDGKRSGSASTRSAPAASAARSRGNLPAPLAGFVGRKNELSELGALLANSRLVSLTGVGGVGKTTLALQAAREQMPYFDDGVWLIELGDVSDSALLPGVAASALRIRDQGGRPLIQVMVDALAEREALVLIDNCENVIDDAAQLVETLLRGCPRLHVLAISREVLGIGGETVLALSPLPYPDTASVPTSRLASYDAVALFVDRARAAQPGFSLTRDNAAAVASICAQLDGLPLAIELATARLRVMSVDQIAERLSDRFGLLTLGRRGAPTRQQTLQWCIGWSFERCTTQEQELWARVSVFAGSFELDAAREICARNISAQELLDELCALVDKSILIRNEDDGLVRFRLLATLREYGKTKIGSNDDYRQLQQRHLDWYQRLVSQAKAEFFSKQQVRWIKWLRREMPNLQEALQFGLENSPTTVLTIAAGMRHMWTSDGMLEEGRRLLDSALAATAAEPTPERIEAVTVLAHLALLQADWATVTTRVAEVRELLQVLPNPEALGQIEWIEGFGALMRGEMDQIQACAEQALAASDDFEVQTLGMSLMSWRYWVAGDAERALQWAEKALALAESRHEANTRSYVLGIVGVGRFALGDLELAERLLSEGLRLCRTIDQSWTGSRFLDALAWVASANHDARRAAVLLAASAAISRASGISSTTTSFAGIFQRQCKRQAREQLSETEFDAASIEGSSLSFEEAAAFALREYI